MALKTEPDVCEGVLFSLLACLMQDGTPESKLKMSGLALIAVDQANRANDVSMMGLIDAVRISTAAIILKDSQPLSSVPRCKPECNVSSRVD